MPTMPIYPLYYGGNVSKTGFLGVRRSEWQVKALTLPFPGRREAVSSLE